MSYAKWIGGTLGWAFGGPIGGILGFVFGSMVDGLQSGSEPLIRQTQIGDFSASLLILSAAIMKADGKVVTSELDYVKSFFVRMFGAEKAKEDMLVLREILKQEIDIRQVSVQVRQYMAYPERLQLLHYLFGIAMADGFVSIPELEMIGNISNYLGINPNDLASIQSMFIKDTNSAYKILEITPESSNEEVKKAYRRMAMKFHPDKVNNLGEDVQKAAHEKFTRVNEAYETIKKERGMV